MQAAESLDVHREKFMTLNGCQTAGQQGIDRRHWDREAAEREVRRPVCTGCGTKFTDAPREAAQATDWGTPKDSHPHLCESCKHAAVAAAHEADRQEWPEPLQRGRRA
ncbi:hypothetical protein AB0H45_17145 [Streptomyces atroolivaceus]|uniref:hypothetical protein n=1 Tax=Streptomyces atroolivaceus TaxID=66869 RepID=UPI0033CCE23A